ncbi:MAG: hypothetical protein HQL15_10125, partial [Candidatus Omnitrophica bacterium]|nr:hypothetical protein [Candidatus Omnitrophota bacterium]
MRANAVKVFMDVTIPDLQDREWIEIRLLPSNPESQFKTKSYFFASKEEALKWFEGFQKIQPTNCSVTMGVTPRNKHKGSKDAVSRIQVLFADLDAKDFPGGKQEMLERLKVFPIPCTARVDSGNGFHVYWSLIEPLVINGVETINCIEEYLKAFVKALGSDPSVAEIARVMRMPGTINFKDPN